MGEGREFWGDWRRTVVGRYLKQLSLGGIVWEGEVPQVFVRNNVYSPSCVFCLLSFIELKKKKKLKKRRIHLLPLSPPSKTSLLWAS